MGLRDGRWPSGEPLDLPGEGPVPAEALEALKGVPVDLDPADPWVLEHGTQAHAYLDASRRAWVEHPGWMDFLDERSPAHALKALEHGLYDEVWGDALDAAETVLDVGCGVGRFTVPLVEDGKTVVAVDADLASLHRCLWHAAGHPGRLDLHWSSAHRLPEGSFDAVVAAEVLCYVPDLHGALLAAWERLRPGGHLLVSFEARWGWAASPDAPPGAIGVALVGDGELDVPDHAWVQTMERDQVQAALEAAGFVDVAVHGSHWVLDGPLEQVAPPPESLDLGVLLDLERAAEAHPVWGRLNRLWIAVARRPGGA